MKKMTSMLLVLSMLFSFAMPIFAYTDEKAVTVLEELQPGSAAIQQYAQTASERAAARLPVAEDYSLAQPLPDEETTLSADETYLLNVVLFAVSEDTEPDELALDDFDLRTLEAVFTDEDGAPRAVGEHGNVWYRAYTTQDADTVAARLTELDGVICAEPDYVYTQDSVGDPTADETSANWAFDALLGDEEGGLWWNSALENDFAPGKDVIVAVIDTGVDYAHEDLAANMWVNEAELNGLPGVDDDGNGIIDDIYGADMTASGSKAGNPMDDHGHGTHVAGIIGMSANGIGGVGLAWGAKIMAIKAGQVTGSFSSTHIAKAISYAKMMGADVINMSFGGTSKSLLVEDALVDAFSSCVLVASAGNNAKPTTDAVNGGYSPFECEDIYPAGYTYVLGVMATEEDGSLASFSNWDYANNANCEYELTAPGVDIYSALPGDRYASWSGTSMAAPCVAAAAAIIRSQYPDKTTYSSRFIMGQLASASEDITAFTAPLKDYHEYSALNIYDSLVNLPRPNITVSDIFLMDSVDISADNDGDAFVDVGETIDLGLVVRNQWGLTGEITVRADAISEGGVPNPNITFLNDTVTLQPAGTFQTVNNGFVYDDSLLVSIEDPIRFRVDATATHDAEICINLTVTTTNGCDENDTTVYTTPNPPEKHTFRINAGRGISGTLTEDTTLTSDYLWVVENSLFIPEGITLTIEPGTKVQFYSSDYEDAYGGLTMPLINCEGTLNAIGTEDAPIEMFPGAGFEQYCVDISGTGVETLQYCKITNPFLGSNAQNYVNIVDHCELVQNYDTVYYRYVSGGSVNSSYRNCLYIRNLTNSVLTNIDCKRWETYQAYICNVVAENCLFDGGDVSFFSPSWSDPGPYSKPTFRPVRKNNVFLQCAGEMSSLGVSVSGLTFSETLAYENYGKKVALVNIEVYDSEDKFNVLVQLAESIGGTLAVIDSEEELAAFYLHWPTSRVYLGAKYNSETEKYEWLRDSEYAIDTSEFNGENEKYPYVCIGPHQHLYNSDSLGSVLFEFPITMADEDITSDLQLFDSASYHKDYSNRFSNNAVLNPVLNADINSWMFIQADDYSKSASSHYATLNYWGTENTTLINKMITDADDFPGTYQDIIIDPILTLDSPELETIYPFVTQVYLTDEDGNIVSNVSPGASYTVHVTFNRDMAQDIQPTVIFGGEDPYADYSVTGDFVSAREWQGSVTISPVLTGGTMYWRTKGGAAADDRWLVCGEDVLRFSFNISTTGTLAMVLNAEGGANKVELTWAQNDYETLAGYNLYRSKSADGSFTKINTAVVTGLSYTDTDVEPGVTYYYYFKVVNTDGNEEESQSNIASGRPVDNIYPVLKHSPVTTAKVGSAVSISATATDNIAIAGVTLSYRKIGDPEYTTMDMTTGVQENLYTATIPGSVVTAAGVEYYIAASDGDGNITYSGTALLPNRITVNTTPYISAITPTTIDMSGGRTITLLGGNLSADMVLKVGGVTVENVSFIDQGQVNFVAPAMASGTYAVTLTTADGSKTYAAPSPLSYTDANSVAQIPTSMEMVSGVAYTIPFYASASGDVIALHAELDLPAGDFASVKVEKADTDAGYSLDYNYSGGVLKIGCMASTNLLPSDGPLLNIIVTPRVSEDKQYDITLHDVSFNNAAAATIISGNAIIHPSFIIAAQVDYYSGEQSPVSGVSITAAGVTGVTDTDGSARLTVSVKNVVISARRDTAAEGAINAYDASLVLQSALGRITLDDYQLLAADVDGNGVVNEYDAALILQMAVKKIDVFPVSYWWVFVPSSKEMSLTDSADNHVSFIAIALGDVNGSYKGDAQ